MKFWSRGEPEKKLYTLVACDSCSYVQLRQFANGDVVIKQVKCTSCKTMAQIKMIYSAPIEH